MNNRFLVPFFILLMVGSFCSIQAEIPTPTVIVDIPEYTVEKIGGWDYVDIPGGGTLFVVGKPRVPFYSVSIEYPVGCRVQVVTMKERSGLMIARDLNLSTVEEPGIQTHEGISSPESGAGWYPEIDFGWQVFLNLDGSSTLMIYVFPFYYNNETKEARFYRHYEFDIAYIFSTISIRELATDKPVYDPGDEVVVNVLVNNSGESRDIVASALIKRYGSDEVVAGLPLRMLHNLTGEASFSMTWGSAGFEAGDYRVEVMLNDTLGNWLDRRAIAFRVGRMVVNVTGFSVEPKHFKIGQPIAVELEATNVGSCPVSGRCVFLIQKAGAEAISFYHNFSSLAPGKSLRFSSTWDTSSAEEGAVYYIIGYVSYESQTTPPVTAIVSTNLFPVAKFNISRTRVGLGEEVTFDASGSSDPDGTIARFKWDFGDGGESSEQTVTHIYHGLGDYEVVLTVTDDKNATSEERQFIKVVMMYTLNVTSNAQVKIGGSGVYREGEKVVLTAPPSVSMPGIVGLLGAKYVFEEWTGAFNSTQSTFEFVFTGYVPRLEAKAIYAEDYTGMIIILSVIVVALLVIVLLSLRRRKGKEIPPPPPPQPKVKS